MICCTKITGSAHPMVRTHPVTGEKALYVDPSYGIGIEGMSPEESAPILRYLTEHLTQPAFTCRLRWEANMLVIWDNRLCVHQAYNDYQGYRREMYRTTVAAKSRPEPVAEPFRAIIGVRLCQNDIVVELDAAGGCRRRRRSGLAEHRAPHARLRVRGDPAAGILALTYPRNTQQISAILRYCNEQRIAVQPQGGMTGLAGGASARRSLRRGLTGAHARDPGDWTARPAPSPSRPVS